MAKHEATRVQEPARKRHTGLIVFLALILLLFFILSVKDRAEGKKLIPRAAMYFWVFAVLALLMSTQYFPWDNIADLLMKGLTREQVCTSSRGMGLKPIN